MSLSSFKGKLGSGLAKATINCRKMRPALANLLKLILIQNAFLERVCSKWRRIKIGTFIFFEARLFGVLAEI